MPPLLGGMERLNLHAALAIAERSQVHVVGPAGCAESLPPAVTVDAIPVKPLWRFIVLATLAAIRSIVRQRPDMVFAGSGLTAPIAVICARIARAKSVVYVHGLDITVEHPVYRRLWLPFIRATDVCIANSLGTSRLARDAGIRADRLVIVHPGVAMPGCDANKHVGSFRAQHGLGTRPVLLAVGRLTPRKGVLEFVRDSLPIIAAAQPDALLVVIGDEAPDALAGNGAGARADIASMAETHGVPENVMFLGPRSDDELSAAYAAASVCIFPVRAQPGDVEGFGMVALEAAAHGLPTVAFEIGGIPDAVSNGVSGRLIRPGDYTAFADATLAYLGVDKGGFDPVACRAFAANFEWEKFGSRLRAAIGYST